MKKQSFRSIDQKRLVRLFKDIKRFNCDETRFCFLLGAGASKSSGIKTGQELSEEWYKDLKEDLSETELIKWEESIGFDKKNIGTFYPYLYKKRYEASPQLGFEEFKKLMENIDPGIGYVILSQILTNEKHNFVITTNFDYLVEDSVRMYTSKKPFSAGHETLAEFISSQTERPTIIKVHRDLFLHPFNDDDQTQKLKEEWKKALMPIVKNFNLLVIGYGGNDGSLMDYLKSINSEDRKEIYWCVRNDNEINDKIRDLLLTKDLIVKIKGFDELMIDLNGVLGYTIFEKLDDPLNHPFVEAAKKRIDNLNIKLQALLNQLSKDKISITKETTKIFTGAKKYIVEAYREKDKSKMDLIFQKGLAEYPHDSDLMEEYASFLTYMNSDYDKAEEYYKKAIEMNPGKAGFFSDYAVFLTYMRPDYDKAEEYYKKAIDLNPGKADFVGNYASFLSYTRKDYDKAEEYYKKAIDLTPEVVLPIFQYASFLADIRKDYDKAEEYYKKAIEMNPEKAVFAYIRFLVDIRKDYDKADEYYKKAIEMDPEEAIIVSNYARFLTDIRKDYDKADEYYKKAIEMDPEEAINVSDYARFLVDIRKDYDKADEYYKKAIEMDPEEAINVSDYARFLTDIRKDYDKAEEYYKKAIEMNPEEAIIVSNYAHHLIISKQDFITAAKYINLAFALVGEYDDDDDEKLDLFSELWFYRYAHYKKWRKKGEKMLEWLTSQNAKSRGLNLKPHIEIAKANNHPDIQKIQKFLDLITI